MQHVALAEGRWQTMTLADQLGNVGSEFGRALSARKRGDGPRFDSAVSRFYELMVLTVTDPRWRGRRRRELARVKEVSGNAFYEGNHETAMALEKYFFQFALLARVGR